MSLNAGEKQKIELIKNKGYMVWDEDTDKHKLKKYFCLWHDKKAWFRDENDGEVMVIFECWEEIEEPKEIPYTIETLPLSTNSGMVRRKDWYKKTFVTGFNVSSGGISIREGVVCVYYSWKKALKELEWLEKSGEVSIFGRKEQ